MGDANKTVIYVDDQATSRSIARQCLKRAGIDVITTADGSECINLVLQKRASLVVTDLRMPKLSGMDLLLQIGECSEETPVILTSQFEDFDEIIDAFNKGAYYFLRKPLNCEELVLVVQRALEQLDLRKRFDEQETYWKNEVDRLNEHEGKKQRFLDKLSGVMEQKRRKMEEERNRLAAREAKYRVLIEKAPLGIFAVNGQFRISEANPALLTLLGFDGTSPIIGSSIKDHDTLVQAGIAEQVLDCLQEGGDRIHSTDYVGPDGIQRVLKYHLTPIESESETTEVLVLIDDITAEAQANTRRERLALYDQVTGLINQNNFEKTLEEQVRIASEENQRLAVAQLDVDYFKSVNDNYGHEVGTKLLAAIGGRIRASIKESRDLGVRNGGDEFVIIYRDYEEGKAEDFVERLFKELSKPYFFPDPGRSALRLECSFSIGVVELAAQTAADLYRDADQATYEAKEKGRNRVVFHRR